MAEVVLRRHKRRVNRWMPKERRFPTRAQGVRAAGLLLRMTPGFLYAFADVLGIPSGFPAAWATAQAAVNRDVRPTVAGALAAMLLRLLNGLDPHWEMLITLALMLAAPLVVGGKGTATVMLWAGGSVLPTVVVGMLAPTAAEMIQSWACAAVAALSAPVMTRALKALSNGRHLSSLEERIAVGFTGAMVLCGGARMLILGVNVGMLLSGAAVLAAGLFLGAGAGALTGMLAGVVMALQGMPLALSVALSMGGFLAGVAQSLNRRALTCAAFAVCSHLPLLLCGEAGTGCGWSVLLAAVGMAMLPREALERLQAFVRRFLPNDPAPGDAYAASALTAWEQTVAAMARAVPAPNNAMADRSPAWWQSALCEGCPECDGCGCLTSKVGYRKAEEVWQCRTAPEEVWQGALEHLRGMGCVRLYHLLDSMNALRREDEAARRVLRQAEAQRDMLVTHLLAMSGAARRFALRSGGESWWDDMAARRICKELSERAAPQSLSFVRRVQGHVQTAFELQFITGARKQAEELCDLVSAVLGAPMQVMSVDGDRVLLAELPLYTAEVGAAAEAITGGNDCGDTAFHATLQDGRCFVALSDGMGHGERAALISRQTVELLRLCLDAGYTRSQTLTAVNGMLLMGGGGERFATADLLTIDLWNGQASLDKLGAASSWLHSGGELTRVSGDALPLGILESVESQAIPLRLAPGDTLVLLTDGVEDAFGGTETLKKALLSALDEPSCADAASAILQEALSADAGERRDDQSAVVIRLKKSAAARPALQADAAGV